MSSVHLAIEDDKNATITTEGKGAS